MNKAYTLREELDSDYIALRDNAMVSGLSMTEDNMRQTKSASSSFRSPSQREVVSKEAMLLRKELKKSKKIRLPTVKRSEYNLADVNATAKVPIWIMPLKPLMRREKGKPLRVWSISVYDDNNPPLKAMFTTAQVLLDRGIIDEVHYHDFGCKSAGRAHQALMSHSALSGEIIVEQRNEIKPSAVGPLATHRAAQSMSIWPRYCTPSMVYDLYARIAENDDVILFSESTLLEYPTPEKVEQLLLTAQTQHKEVAWSANLINNAVTSWMHQALRVLPFSIASLDIPSGDGLKSDLDINGALAYKLALHYARNKEAYSSMDGYVSVPTGVGMNLDFAAVRGERLQQAQKHILNGLHPVVALTQKVAQEQAAVVKVDLGVLAVQGARASQSAYGRDMGSVINFGAKTSVRSKPVDHPTSRVFNQSRSENLNIWMIFAGRRSRLELQVSFWIEAIEKGFIDEVHLWDFTCLFPNKPDRKENYDYLIELSGTYPWVFVFDTPCNGWAPAYSFYQIWLREQDVVIKGDDDIIYVRVDAIPGFTAAVREHPILDIVSANVINNGVCAYFMQAHARCSTPEEIGVMEYPENAPHNAWGGTLWESKEAVMRVHEHFVKNPTCYFSMQGLQKYSERLSINFLAWSGAKADRVAWYASFGDDETFLTHMWNTVDKGQQAIYNPLIVSHATFGSDQQHAYDFIFKLYKDAKLSTSLR